MATLTILLNGVRLGVLTQGDSGRLTCECDTAAGPPLSLSMPRTVAVHTDPVVRPFCQGLLPDNEVVLERWGREFQVSPGNPFALLRHVGEDCAGAVQFAPEDRVEALLARDGKITPLSEDEIAERLRILRGDPSAWHLARGGQFSLAGAQAKTALHHDAETGRWGDPSGAVPTTHILKPAIRGFDDHDLNEHLCLRAAHIAGLRTAASRVLSFGDERVVAVERYDRRRLTDGTVVRVHQEDVCQALSVPPTRKYQSEGGPTPEQVIALIRASVIGETAVEQDVGRFVDALAFNWLIAGTDAHAKNYSVLLAERQVRLAPLYDVASSLPYDDMYLPRLRLAMRIGSEYRVAAIRGRHWADFARQNGLDPDRTISRVDDLARRLPGAFREAASADAITALGSALPGHLTGRVTEHAERCRKALES